MLRVVGASEVHEALSKAERIERIMRECIASNPDSVLVVWESNAVLSMRCEPALPTVLVGLVELAKMQVRGDL